MVLDHLAAVLFFGGPLLYIGLWMVFDAAAIAGLVKVVARASGTRGADALPRMRTGVRCAGVLLVLIAIAL